MSELIKRFPLLFVPLFLFSGIWLVGIIISSFVGEFKWMLNTGGVFWAGIFIIGLIAEGIRGVTGIDWE